MDREPLPPCVVSVRSAPAGNIKPNRKKSTEKIDSAVARIMGLARAALGGGAADPLPQLDLENLCLTNCPKKY